MREGVLHAHPETIPVATSVILRKTTCRNSLSVLGHLSLLLSDKVCASRVREVGNKPEANGSNKDTDDSFKKEEPLPSSQISNALHVGQDAGGQKTGQSLRDGVSSVPDTHPERGLVLCVPGTGHQRDSRDKGSFDETNEETAEAESPAGGHGRHADGNAGPGHHASGKEDARASFGDDDIGGDLRNDVSDVEQRDTERPGDVRHV